MKSGHVKKLPLGWSRVRLRWKSPKIMTVVHFRMQTLSLPSFETGSSPSTSLMDKNSKGCFAETSSSSLGSSVRVGYVNRWHLGQKFMIQWPLWCCWLMLVPVDSYKSRFLFLFLLTLEGLTICLGSNPARTSAGCSGDSFWGDRVMVNILATMTYTAFWFLNF